MKTFFNNGEVVRRIDGVLSNEVAIVEDNGISFDVNGQIVGGLVKIRFKSDQSKSYIYPKEALIGAN